MSARKYKLSEEICLQCMEVVFEKNGWKEWFTNPTAGPWKKIRIEGVEDEELLRFRKEEDRPDLILAHESKQLIMVLEAKDNINGLLSSSGGQIKKSTKVFKAMFEKLLTILRKHGEAIYGGSKPSTLLLCGYIFPIASSVKKMEHDLEQLNQLHEKECKEMKEVRLVPHMIFAITSDPRKSLRVFYISKSLTPELISKINELFPKEVSDIARYAPIENNLNLNHVFLNSTK